jgi:hypothetical protein
VALGTLTTLTGGPMISRCDHGAAAAAAPPSVRVVVDTSLPAQQYELRARTLPGQGLELAGGDTNGVTYGLLELPRLLRRRQRAATSTQHGGPAYTSRVYSIEGQYLDLPDVAYYSSEPPTFLNTSLIVSEANAIARGLPALVKNKVTALVVLHPNVEDYITYKYLGNGDEVWPAATSQQHLQRAGALCSLVFAENHPNFQLLRNQECTNILAISMGTMADFVGWAGLQACEHDARARAQVLLQAVRARISEAAAEAVPSRAEHTGQGKQHACRTRSEIQGAVRVHRRRWPRPDRRRDTPQSWVRQHGPGPLPRKNTSNSLLQPCVI